RTRPQAGPSDMLLQLLPERLLRGHPAILHQRPDGVPELVEGNRADGRLALRLLVAVDPVRDSLLVVRIECEELFARDLIHALLCVCRRDRTCGEKAAEHHTERERADE